MAIKQVECLVCDRCGTSHPLHLTQWGEGENYEDEKVEGWWSSYDEEQMELQAFHGDPDFCKHGDLVLCESCKDHYKSGGDITDGIISYFAKKFDNVEAKPQYQSLKIDGVGIDIAVDKEDGTVIAKTTIEHESFGVEHTLSDPNFDTAIMDKIESLVWYAKADVEDLRKFLKENGIKSSAKTRKGCVAKIKEAGLDHRGRPKAVDVFMSYFEKAECESDKTTHTVTAAGINFTFDKYGKLTGVEH